jgi:hypothetical protein
MSGLRLAFVEQRFEPSGRAVDEECSDSGCHLLLLSEKPETHHGHGPTKPQLKPFNHKGHEGTPRKTKTLNHRGHRRTQRGCGDKMATDLRRSTQMKSFNQFLFHLRASALICGRFLQLPTYQIAQLPNSGAVSVLRHHPHHDP